MIKPFLWMLGVLFAMLVATASHYISFDSKSISSALLSMASVTQMTDPSLSVAYHEPRLLQGDTANIIYPEMPSTDRMDFVYAK